MDIIKKLIILYISTFYGQILFSQSDLISSLVLKDYLRRSYSETKTTSNFNYLSVKGERYPNSKNQFLFLQFNDFNNKKRASEISNYLKLDLENINLNANKILTEILNTRKYDTTSTSISNVRCKGGIIISGLLKERTKQRSIYLIVTKFNSKYPNRQIELLVKYKLINNNWKFISEEMISIT
jgi:hypothetical protein